MDFDEYESLEKTGDIPKPEKFKDLVNGSDIIDKSENKDPSRRPKQKSDRQDEDFDHQLKRSRKGDEPHHRENSSLCNRSSSIERERNEREKHRRSRESNNRIMDIVREDSGRKERDGDKIRERNRERCRDRDRERRDRNCVYERETDRGREQERPNHSRNYSERYEDEWDRERSRDKGRSRGMESKERDRVREVRENDQESRPAGEGVVGFTLQRRTKEKKEEVAKLDADLERDQQTVFAYQISLKADERDVYEFFSRAGKVRDVRLIMDRNSRHSKGVGYIEFYDVMSVPLAIALSGQPLLGQPVMVKPSEAEKNLVQSATVAAGAAGLAGPCSGETRQLYVGNLHLNMKEDQLRQVFEPFGTIELVQLPSDPETGHSKGYGFVQFARLEDARAARALDGQVEIAGQMMKVATVTDQAGWQEADANAGDFDDNGPGALKLSCAATTSSIAGSLGAAPAVSPPVAPFGQTPVPAITGLPTAGSSIPAAVPPIYTIGVPSECLLLKNMFDPKVESEPDFDQDIKDDIEDECSKFGDLKHIYVDRNSAGFVYLRFQDSQSAIAAQRALHGRWFAGKMITATFVMPQNYESKFPLSK